MIISLTREVVELLPQLEQNFDTQAFASKIRSTTKVKEASAARQPLFQYDPYCTAAIDYAMFIDEMLKGVGK